MAYTPTTWATGDKISSVKMNKLEQGVADAQPALVSGTNIKTIGGKSLLGAGDIPVQEIFPVNLTETTQMHFTADKTFAECLAAFSAGKRLIFNVASDTLGVSLVDVTNYSQGFFLASVLVQSGLSEPTHFIFSISYSANGLAIVPYEIIAALG